MAWISIILLVPSCEVGLTLYQPTGENWGSEVKWVAEAQWWVLSCALKSRPLSSFPGLSKAAQAIKLSVTLGRLLCYCCCLGAGFSSALSWRPASPARAGNTGPRDSEESNMLIINSLKKIQEIGFSPGLLSEPKWKLPPVYLWPEDNHQHYLP